MMKRKDFYNIALYGNNTWKGTYSAREVVQNASVYYSDYVWCLRNRKVTETMMFLVDKLMDDYANGATQVSPWLWGLIGIFTGMEVRR